MRGDPRIIRVGAIRLALDQITSYEERSDGQTAVCDRAGRWFLIKIDVREIDKHFSVFDAEGEIVRSRSRFNR